MSAIGYGNKINVQQLNGTMEVGKDVIVVGNNTFMGNMSIQRMTGTIIGPFGSIPVSGQKVEIVDGVVTVDGARADRLAANTQDGKGDDEAPAAPKPERASESRRTVNLYVTADVLNAPQNNTSAPSAHDGPSIAEKPVAGSRKAQAVNELSLRALILNAAFAAFFPSPLYLGVCLAVATAIGFGLLMDHSDNHRVRVAGFGLKAASVAWIIGSMIYYAGAYIASLVS